MAISSLARPRNLEWHHVATCRTRHVIVITHQESAIITSHLKVLSTARQISPGRNHCHSVRSRPYISPTSLPASACQAVLTPKTHGPPIYPSLVRLRGQMSRPFRSQVLQCVPYVSRTQAFKFRPAYLPSGTLPYHKCCPPVVRFPTVSTYCLPIDLSTSPHWSSSWPLVTRSRPLSLSMGDMSP